MGKSKDGKLRLLYVRDILDAHRGAAHAITMAQLLCLLAASGVEADRKSIYADLKLLELYGMAIGREGSLRYRRYFTR